VQRVNRVDRDDRVPDRAGDLIVRPQARGLVRKEEFEQGVL
jgi:hypothetical protein